MIPAYVTSFMVYGIVTPYLSIMVRDLGYSPGWVGILLGVFEGAGIAGPFVFGWWADRAGSYRWALAAANLLPALAAVPLVFAVHPLASAGLLAALAFGCRSTISLLDAVTTIQLGKTGNYGRIRTTGSIGFIVFLLFLQWTPFLAPNSAGNIAFWITASSALSVIPILLLPRAALNGTGFVRKEVTSAQSPAYRSAQETAARGMPPTGHRPFHLSLYFMTGFLLISICRLSMAAVYTYFPLYLTEEMHWDAVGLMFALSCAAEVPVMFVSSRLVRRFGALPLLALAAAGISIRLLIWALLPYKALVAAAQLLHSLCFGIYHPAAVYFITTVFPPEKRAVGMSVYLALGSGLPALIGNMIGGGIAETSGYRPLFAIYASFTAAALVFYGIVRLKGTLRQR